MPDIKKLLTQVLANCENALFILQQRIEKKNKSDKIFIEKNSCGALKKITAIY